MNEQLTARDFDSHVVPSRVSRVEQYLWDHSDDVSSEIAADLHEPTKRIEATNVLIPVAAHQEAGSIVAAVEAYGKQRINVAPFTVLMLFNYPKGANLQTVADTYTEFVIAKSRFPNLDMRLALRQYEKPTIGQIRKDLWDAVAKLALEEDTFSTTFNDVILINHDIDTLSMNPYYIGQIQAYYTLLQKAYAADGLPSDPLPPSYTQVKHAYPFDTHPNAAKVVFWKDFVYRQMYPEGCYEEGTVIPLSHYAAKGGFKASSVTHETKLLTPSYPAGIWRTSMETSPRRYITRLALDSSAEIWTNDSFSANDACRLDISRVPDITFSQVEDRLLEELEDDLRGIINGARSRNSTKDVFEKFISDIFTGRRAFDDRGQIIKELTSYFERRLAIAGSVLRRVVGSDTLADITAMTGSSLIRQELDCYFETVKKELEGLDVGASSSEALV